MPQAVVDISQELARETGGVENIEWPSQVLHEGQAGCVVSVGGVGLTTSGDFRVYFDFVGGVDDRDGPSPRANLVRMQAELAESLKEEISDTYNFHRRVPSSFIKVFYGEIPGCRDDKAREFAREALAEYDSAVAAGKADSLHRVAHLFGKGLIRQELDQFVSSVLPLRVFFPLRTPW